MPADVHEVLYMLRPVKEVHPGWVKLRWRPIFRQTYSMYFSSGSAKAFGVRFWRSDAHNGWGRAWDGFHVEISFWKTFNFWIRWNFIVMTEGPMGLNRGPIPWPPSERLETHDKLR